MKILLAQNMFHVPAHGGANKLTRVILEQMAARGHVCHVVAPLSGRLGGGDADLLAGILRAHGEAPPVPGEDALTYRLGGVAGHAVLRPSRFIRQVRAVAAALEPDWILVPSDDPGGMAIGAAHRCAPGRVVYIACTLQQLPFWPDAFYPSETVADMVRRCAGAVAISRAAQDCLLRWGGVRSRLIHPALYGNPPWPDGASVDVGAVTMINPCAYKGICIFLDLADAFPDTRFLAVPTWGTTAADEQELTRRPNIEVARPVDEIDLVLRRTSVLLLPSLWDETFGFSAVEAMLRGIPTIASDVGGLSEAKLGVPHLLPVRRITRYDSTVDVARPVPTVPAQEPGPWAEALGRLLNDPDHYAAVSVQSRHAAVEFVARLDEGALEAYLLELGSSRDRGAQLVSCEGSSGD